MATVGTGSPAALLRCGEPKDRDVSTRFQSKKWRWRSTSGRSTPADTAGCNLNRAASNWPALQCRRKCGVVSTLPGYSSPGIQAHYSHWRCRCFPTHWKTDTNSAPESGTHRRPSPPWTAETGSTLRVGWPTATPMETDREPCTTGTGWHCAGRNRRWPVFRRTTAVGTAAEWVWTAMGYWQPKAGTPPASTSASAGATGRTFPTNKSKSSASDRTRPIPSTVPSSPQFTSKKNSTWFGNWLRNWLGSSINI